MIYSQMTDFMNSLMMDQLVHVMTIVSRIQVGRFPEDSANKFTFKMISAVSTIL